MFQGRSFPFDAIGRAFTALPMYRSEASEGLDGLTCNIEMLLDMLTYKVRFDALSIHGINLIHCDMRRIKPACSTLHLFPVDLVGP